jgi:cellulose synthase (UDP-forming)
MSHATVLPAPREELDSHPAPSAQHLPSPPDDDEVYWYFGPQRRWVLLFTSLSFTFTAIALFFFSLSEPMLWIFFAVLGLNVGGQLMSLIDTQNRRRLTRESHDLLIRAWRPRIAPSVDVYLPTCGEPLEVLRNAYLHVRGLSWDGPVRIWVLDDAARPEVRELATSFGYEYRSRPDRGHLKKAGNLNYALGITDGELIAIFDADFCPRPDFLRHLVPYFETPDVGIVQSPQCFDTDESMSWLERSAGAAQEWFFRWIQPSRDACDAAICCGSNAVYRRSALTRVGGFAKLEHSEDMYTGLDLLKHGYRTRYVPLLLAKGLSPDTVASYLNQQYRWAMGNLHLLRTRDYREVSAGWRLVLSYWNGVVSYVLTAVNVFAAPLPPLFMMVFHPADVRPWHVLPMILPLWSWLVLLPAVSKSRWRIEVIRAHQLVGFASAMALVHTLRGRSANWVPTGVTGGGSPLARKVSMIAFGWLGVTTAASIVSFAVGLVNHGCSNYWGFACYLALTSYLMLPLLRDLGNSLRLREKHVLPKGQRNQVQTGRSWPEALAVTVALGVFSLVASGWVDGILQ